MPIKLLNDFILVCCKNYLLILIHGSVKVVIKNKELTTTTTTNKFENHLLSIRAEHQKRIRPNLLPTYNVYHEKFVDVKHI